MILRMVTTVPVVMVTNYLVTILVKVTLPYILSYDIVNTIPRY